MFIYILLIILISINMIAQILNIVSLLVIIYDTLGHVVAYKNYEKEESKTDYNRLIKTWIFYAAFKTLGCCLCSDEECFFSGFLAIVFAVVKLGIALPITGIANKLCVEICDNQILTKGVKSVVDLVKGQVEKFSGKKTQ